MNMSKRFMVSIVGAVSVSVSALGCEGRVVPEDSHAASRAETEPADADDAGASAAPAMPAALPESPAPAAANPGGSLGSLDDAGVEATMSDAGETAGEPYPVPPFTDDEVSPEACGFGVGGHVQASIVGTSASACTPFTAFADVSDVWFSCTGVAGGLTYTASGQAAAGGFLGISPESPDQVGSSYRTSLARFDTQDVVLGQTTTVRFESVGPLLTSAGQDPAGDDDAYAVAGYVRATLTTCVIIR